MIRVNAVVKPVKREAVNAHTSKSCEDDMIFSVGGKFEIGDAKKLIEIT